MATFNRAKYPLLTTLVVLGCLVALTACSGLSSGQPVSSAMSGESIAVFSSSDGVTQERAGRAGYETLDIQFQCQGAGVMTIEVNDTFETLDCTPGPDDKQRVGFELGGKPFSVGISFDESGDESSWSVSVWGLTADMFDH